MSSSCHAKKVTVIVHGSYMPPGTDLRDVELQSGATAGDVLWQLGLPDYLLCRDGSAIFWGQDDVIFAEVQDGQRLRALPNLRPCQVGPF